MSGGTSFVSAAFKSCTQDEAYIFLNDTFVVDNYAPGQATDTIVSGPTIVSKGFPCLNNTIIGDNGVDCAFASHDVGKAYLFSGNFCALLWFSPKVVLVDGPKPIKEMFPYLSGTVFENGVDAAFESSVEHEAYLFKGDQYARINYNGCSPCLMNQGPIGVYWPCLKGTIFECNIGGAFASDRLNEAYMFKGQYYVHLKFTPGQTNDTIPGGVRLIKNYWPQLTNFLPKTNMSRN